MRSSEFFARAYGSSDSPKNGKRPLAKKSTANKQKHNRKHTTSVKAETKSSAPNKNWSPDELVSYIEQHLRDREEMQETLASIGRKSAVALYRAGHGLQLLREKLKVNGAWEQTLRDKHIGKGTANEAIRLYGRATAQWGAKAEAELAKRTITEAKVDLGITKKKKKPAPKLRFPNPDVGDGNGAVAPPQVTRADEFLVAMVKRLEEVVKWDRTDLDVHQLDAFARRCINLLETFVLPALANKPAKKVTGSKQSKGGGKDVA